MWRLIHFGFDRGPWIIASVAVLTVLAFFRLDDVVIDVSSDSLSRSDHPLRAQYLATRAEFGSDLVAVVYAEDPDLFSTAQLTRLQAISDALAHLEFVERVDSLFTLPDIRDVGGYLETAPLLAELPEDPAALAAKRQQALENPLLHRNVLSSDATATVLTVYLDPAALERLALPAIEAQLEALLAPHREAFASLYQLGKPAVQTWLLEALDHDQRRILPLAAILLFILLALNQRSIYAGAIPIMNGIIAALWTIALMSLVGIPVNLLNYILPALILVVGATEDVHLLHEFRSAVASGTAPRVALEQTARTIGLALLLTATTTILGFAATTLSTLPILQSFGIAAMIGMGVRFSLSLIFLPALLRYHPASFRRGAASVLVSPTLATRASRAIVRLFVPRMVPLIIVSILFATGAAYFAGRINVSNDLVSFIDEDAEIHQQLEASADRLAGSKILYLTLHDSPGAFYQPAKLKQLAAISEYLRGIGEIDTVTSFADIIARINAELRGGAPTDYRIPDSTAAVRQMLLFTRRDDFAAYISSDFARANVVIRCDLNDSTLLNQRAEEIRTQLASGAFGPQVFTLTGEALVVAAAVDSIVHAQILSLGGMAVILFLIVSGLFLSVRCGVLVVLSNLFPIIVVFGAMGLIGISLNVGTCMIAAITIGIAIDDTLHLLVRFNRELKSTKSERTAIENALRHEINPIVSTSLALAGGFLMLAFSSFAPVREFGLLSAGVLLVALTTDLILTPVLFANTQLVTLWDVVGLTLRRQLLKDSPLFQGFTPWQAKKIIVSTEIIEHPPGAFVIREGDLDNQMYVVLSGKLEASVGKGAKRHLLTEIGPGDVFGEVALVAHARRSADVIAQTETRLLALDADSLDRLRRFSPFLSSRLFLNLATIIGNRLLERTREAALLKQQQQERESERG